MTDAMQMIREALDDLDWSVQCLDARGQRGDRIDKCFAHIKNLKTALSTIDPEDNALKVGRYFCAQMPCSPTDCTEVPCRYMKDAIANRNNRDPEAIRREARAGALREVEEEIRQAGETSIEVGYEGAYIRGIDKALTLIAAILGAEPVHEDEEFGPVNLNDVEPDRLKPAQDDGKPKVGDLIAYESPDPDDNGQMLVAISPAVFKGRKTVVLMRAAELKRRIEEAKE